MGLLHKEDWDDAKQRYRAWWAGEAIGRCGLAVTAPKAHPPDIPEPTPPETVEAFWTDLDCITAMNEYRLGRTVHGGEAVPLWHGGFPGDKSLPVFLGCPITLDWRTGWVEPIVTGDDLSDVFALELDDDEPHFRFASELLKRGVREAAGKALVATGAFGGTGDTLPWLRGTGATALRRDRAPRPGPRRRATPHGPVVSGVRAVLPDRPRDERWLDRHVDALCELPDLQALQILPGAGKPSPLHYMDVLRRVQAKGKNLHITIPAEEVETALEHLSARGLFIHTACTTEQEARDLLRHAQTWSKDRPR